MNIEIDLQIWVEIYARSISIFCSFPWNQAIYHIDNLTHDKLIYHKNLSDFFPKYPNTHLGNTLL
jgi:hypothetical protein